MQEESCYQHLPLLLFPIMSHQPSSSLKTMYLWNASTGSISELCSQEADGDYISSVSWLNDGVHVAIGTASAQVQIWDAQAQRKIRTMSGHDARVAALSWNEHTLSSGNKNGVIINSDVRIQEHVVATLRGHTQEVCGLRWSPDGKNLARCVLTSFID